MNLKQLNLFSDFQKSDFLTDIQINLKNGAVNAHKLVLAVNSEFFKMLFNNSCCKEVITGVVELPSMDVETFSFILDYIYLRNEDHYSLEDISFYIDVIAASDFLGMLDFIEYVDLKLSKNFNESYLKNFERMLLYNLSKTVRKCEKCVIEFINKKNYEKILAMSAETFIKFIERYNFAVEENVLFNFICIFISNKKSSNDDILIQILRHVRVSLLNENYSSYFQKFVKQFGLNCDHFIEAKSEPRCVSFLYVVNRSNNIIVSIDKVDLCDYSKVEVVNTSSLNFNICRIYNHYLVLLKDHFCSSDNLGTLINLATSKSTVIGSFYSHLPDIDIFRQYGGFAIVLIESDFYILGGFYFTHENITVATKTVIKYNITKEQWSVVEEVFLKEPCWSHAVAASYETCNLVYVSGGRNHKKYFNNFYNINLITKEITDLLPLPKEIYGHKMENYKSIIAVFDGNHKNEIYFFDLQCLVWRSVDCSTTGIFLHLSYCFNTSDETSKDALKLLELSRNICKDKTYVYSREVKFGDPDLLVTSQPVMMLAFKDSRSNDVYMGKSVYGCDKIVVTLSEDFDTTCDSD